MSKEDLSLDQDKKVTHEHSITTSTSTSSIISEEILDTHGEPHSNSNCTSTSISFEDSDARITYKGINRTSLQGNATKCTCFNESSHDTHVLKVSSEISIVDSMNFDDFTQLDLSSIYNNSQDDWSCGSQSTYDSNLDDLADDLGLLD